MPTPRPEMVADPAPGIRLRPIELAELRKLLEIFSQAIPHDQLGRSIYLAPGVEAYLAAVLQHPRFHAHEQLWGVDLDTEGLVAGAHTRLLGENHHLNNYAVLPAFQRRGLGARMILHWHALARAQGARSLSLDVDLDNEGARRHYAAFGLAEVARSGEYRLRESVQLPPPDGVQLHDWPAARANFEAYGFGRFALTAGPQRCAVDLRVKAFRLSSSDRRFLAALRVMDPARAILVRTPDHLDAASWVLTGTMVRMTKELG